MKKKQKIHHEASESDKQILEILRASADRVGCEPLWLKANKLPQVQITESTSSNGPVVLLLHGLFGAVSNWDGVFNRFAAFCRPIAVKFPLLTGHKTEIGIKSLALLTEAFIRSRGYENVLICGNSLGGHVGLRLTLASPQLVKGLVLAGTSGLYEHTVDSLPLRPDHRFVREHMSKVFFNQALVTEDAIMEVAEILKTRKHVLNLVQAAKSAKKDNLQKLLPIVNQKTLLLWGEEDTVTTMEVAHQFKDLMPNSRLVTMKGCGHAPMIEHPEWFSAQVESFFREQNWL